MHIKVKELPAILQQALESVGFHGADIRVETRETTELSNAGWGGKQAYVCIVNLGTGQFDTSLGSWGGPNIANPENSVDNDRAPYVIPANCAIVKGYRGEVLAHIETRPETLRPLLPAPVTLTEEERHGLHAYRSIKAGEYRKDYLRRNKVQPETLNSLVSRGYLKRSANGATQITTEGKNAISDIRPGSGFGH